MSIRAVIFDVGGVLSRRVDFTSHRQWERYLGLKEGQLTDLVFENEVARKATLGAASPEQVWQFVGQSLNLSPEDLEMLELSFWTGSEWDIDLLDFARDLHPHCKTGILSDAWINTRVEIREYINSDIFDVIMFSAEEGLQKPSPELFRRILARLDVAPHEAIFVDDRPNNVEGAEQLGIHGLLFTDSKSIRDQIAALIQNP